MYRTTINTYLEDSVVLTSDPRHPRDLKIYNAEQQLTRIKKTLWWGPLTPGISETWNIQYRTTINTYLEDSVVGTSDPRHPRDLKIYNAEQQSTRIYETDVFSGNQDKTNHPMSSNSHPWVTANKAILCLKWGWGTKTHGNKAKYQCPICWPHPCLGHNEASEKWVTLRWTYNPSLVTMNVSRMDLWTKRKHGEVKASTDRQVVSQTDR